ncbi:PKD-like family lipoprotein [Paraflavitalea pollutisoli]|uniref:PKD-like family lipoprotein n=1 Tax=Paraflavitalea pollutisoli TaxID=3034143 RepID=UPI0023EB6594|nr:PKD-like family lipoprotein [Paraflavitalea sp. H1-2-19X]
MRKIFIMIVAAGLLILAGCYKDKGNYEYSVPEAPLVTNLDTVYSVFVGDSLIVKPTVNYSHPEALRYDWKIAVPEILSDLTFKGPAIRTVFGIGANRYNARLTITDSSNGMKYFYTFIVSGKTDFFQGTTVLSEDKRATILSFIKADGTVVPNIYEAANPGEKLGDHPRQLIGLRHDNIAPKHISSYWVFTDGGNKGVQISSNTMKKKKDLAGNFFTPPATITPGDLIGTSMESLNGVISGKLYAGTTQTWNLNPLYNMFGLPAEGDYNLFDQAAFNSVMPYFLGYDKVRKQVVAFTNFGTPAYIGTTYTAVGDTFDLRKVGLDLLYFTQVNNGNCFALGKDASGTLKEIKFGAAFMGFIQLRAEYIRTFAQPALIKPDTKWAFAPAEIFYFTSGDKIYRYNPLNQDIRALVTDFGGKAVTMLKFIDGGNTLLAGTAGSLYQLDVSTGKFGEIIKKQDGIPGNTIDAVIRNDR